MQLPHPNSVLPMRPLLLSLFSSIQANQEKMSFNISRCNITFFVLGLALGVCLTSLEQLTFGKQSMYTIVSQIKDGVNNLSAFPLEPPKDLPGKEGTQLVSLFQLDEPYMLELSLPPRYTFNETLAIPYKALIATAIKQEKMVAFVMLEKGIRSSNRKGSWALTELPEGLGCAFSKKGFPTG